MIDFIYYNRYFYRVLQWETNGVLAIGFNRRDKPNRIDFSYADQSNIRAYRTSEDHTINFYSDQHNFPNQTKYAVAYYNPYSMLFHRIDGPAVKVVMGDGRVVVDYFLNGNHFSSKEKWFEALPKEHKKLAVFNMDEIIE